jgi:DNA excision repair protein ERCC-2
LQRAWSALSREQTAAYAVYASLPKRLEIALGDATAAITSHLAEAPSEIDGTLLRFYFDALHFNRLAETFGTHSIFDVSIVAQPGARGTKLTNLCIRNVVPAPFLKARYAAAQATVLFSATLTP